MCAKNEAHVKNKPNGKNYSTLSLEKIFSQYHHAKEFAQFAPAKAYWEIVLDLRSQKVM